jgi:proteasome accessory factor A
MLEAGVTMRDMSLGNPIRAIRDMSHDITGKRQVKLSTGRELSAWSIQMEYFEKASEFALSEGLVDDPTVSRVLELWGRTLKAVEADDSSLIDREIDWAIKRRVLERYMSKHGLSLDSPRIAQLDLAYHDINRNKSIFYLMERQGLVERVTTDLQVFEAKTVPPQTTRAKLRGDFVRRAQERRRDFTVDWVHLKLNDQAQRTVLCKDPFVAVDERVERLIASM